MYNAYLITYDLKQPVASYFLFFNEIRMASKWWHYLPNTWIIISEQTPTNWQTRLLSKTYIGDFFLIIQIKPYSDGFLPKDAWDWINANVPA